MNTEKDANYVQLNVIHLPAESCSPNSCTFFPNFMHYFFLSLTSSLMQVGAAPREDSTNPKERNRYWVACPVSHSTTCIGERRKVTKKKPTNFFIFFFLYVYTHTYRKKKMKKLVGYYYTYVLVIVWLIMLLLASFFVCMYTYVHTEKRSQKKPIG